MEDIKNWKEANRKMGDAILALADYLNCNPDMGAIGRCMYRQTGCGAWVAVDGAGSIRIGSIVEGSDAEFSITPIPTDGRKYDDIKTDLDEALDWLECEVEIAWIEANIEDEED